MDINNKINLATEFGRGQAMLYVFENCEAFCWTDPAELIAVVGLDRAFQIVEAAVMLAVAECVQECQRLLDGGRF